MEHSPWILDQISARITPASSILLIAAREEQSGSQPFDSRARKPLCSLWPALPQSSSTQAARPFQPTPAQSAPHLPFDQRREGPRNRRSPSASRPGPHEPAPSTPAPAPLREERPPSCLEIRPMSLRSPPGKGPPGFPESLLLIQNPAGSRFQPAAPAHKLSTRQNAAKALLLDPELPSDWCGRSSAAAIRSNRRNALRSADPAAQAQLPPAIRSTVRPPSPWRNPAEALPPPLPHSQRSH